MILIDCGEPADVRGGPNVPREAVGYLPSNFGPAVLLNERGQEIARSIVRVQASVVAAAPDGKRFVFIGSIPLSDYSVPGLYVASFTSGDVRKLADLVPRGKKLEIDFANEPDVDWSPDGSHVLFSDAGQISNIEVGTNTTREVSKGGRARWSPDGSQISYLSAIDEVTVLNVKTNASNTVDPGRKSGRAAEWSPDGKYLLIAETVGSHVPYGCLWVCRLEDRTWMPVPYYGMARPHPQWFAGISY